MRRLKYPGLMLLAAAFTALPAPAQEPDFKLGKNIEILINMMRDISIFYVDETDPDQLMQDAAEGMTMRLDPYTEYIAEEEMEQFEVLTTGKYGGIGSLIRKKDDHVIITQPYKGFPADKAGLRAGDKILAIDGEDARGFDAQDVSSRLKGDPGTTVRLKVEKFHTGQVEEIAVKRERITIPGVPYYGFVDDSVGYIQHVDFTEGSGDEMRNALMELRGSGRLKGLVIDYRGNGGGIMREAVDIMSLFVPKGTEVVSMKGKMMEAPVVFRTETEPVDLDVPIVVLTSSGSASAAEIVAGAIQDLDRGVLIGQRTFGKGLVQATRPLGYNSYLKVTTAKYYIPSGRCIQAIDYAHRNDDGSVAFVPDSLVVEFQTAGGRKVYDGGGVMPDIRTTPEYVSRFTLITYGKGYIEDFVDLYTKNNPEPVDPLTFRFTDEDYAAFVRFMEDKDVEFESESKRALENLRTRSRLELYHDDIKDQLEIIEALLKDDKESNLELYREQLTDILESEIVLRSHYSEGVTAYKLPRDKEVLQAVELLRDRERYREIITSKDTDRK